MKNGAKIVGETSYKSQNFSDEVRQIISNPISSAGIKRSAEEGGLESKQSPPKKPNNQDDEPVKSSSKISCSAMGGSIQNSNSLLPQ